MRLRPERLDDLLEQGGVVDASPSVAGRVAEDQPLREEGEPGQGLVADREGVPDHGRGGLGLPIGRSGGPEVIAGPRPARFLRGVEQVLAPPSPSIGLGHRRTGPVVDVLCVGGGRPVLGQQRRPLCHAPEARGLRDPIEVGRGETIRNLNQQAT